MLEIRKNRICERGRVVCRAREILVLFTVVSPPCSNSLSKCSKERRDSRNIGMNLRPLRKCLPWRWINTHIGLICSCNTKDRLLSASSLFDSSFFMSIKTNNIQQMISLIRWRRNLFYNLNYTTTINSIQKLHALCFVCCVLRRQR